MFYKISSIKSYNYPYSITLSNDNIFLIQKTGIDIYDKSLNKLNQIFEFTEEEEMTSEKFSKIVLKYNNLYILSVINDKMFIFNNEGKLLYKSEQKINDDQIIISYSLTFINVTNNICDFVLGYFDEDCYLNLYLYRYDNENNNITLLSKDKNNLYLYKVSASYYPGIYFTYKQKILSCEYMYYTVLSFNFNNLICFINSNSSIGIVAYNILDNNTISQFKGLTKNAIFISTQNVDDIKITSIKSEINNNRTLAIVWWNFKGDNQTRYYIYNLTNMISTASTRYINNLYSWKLSNACMDKEYGTRINAFPFKNQFSFSCVLEDKNVQILLYNKENLINDTYIINPSCENIKGLSKLYFNDNTNYYIYPCFINCSDKKFENDPYCINKRNNRNKILIVIIIVIIIILLIVLIILYIKYYKKKKFERDYQKGKKDDELMQDIMTNFMPENK